MLKGWSRGGVLALLAAVLGVAGCSGSAGPPAPQATVPPTVASADPYAVPRTITTAYVQRVLDALEAIDAVAVDDIVATRSFPPDAASHLRATYGDQEFQAQTASWLNQIHSGLANYQAHPGPVRDHIVNLISASPSCVFVAVTRDYSAVARQLPRPHTSYFQLTQAQAVDDPHHLNPTGWAIALEGYNSNGQVPADPCKSS